MEIDSAEAEIPSTLGCQLESPRHPTAKPARFGVTRKHFSVTRVLTVHFQRDLAATLE
jgi:hypothetical protein